MRPSAASSTYQSTITAAQSAAEQTHSWDHIIPSTYAFMNDEFATIYYLYIETETSRTSSDHLGNIEALWREEGRLILQSSSGCGIWAFGTVEQVSDFKHSLRSSASEASSGSSQAVDWKVVLDASFQPNAVFKGNKPGPSSGTAAQPSHIASGSTKNLPSQPVNLQHDNSRHEKQEDGRGGHEEDDIQVTDRKLLELFISAILASISARLCQSKSMLSLNSRTLVKNDTIIGDQDPRSIVGREAAISIVTLDVQMTSQNSLILKTMVKRAAGMGCFKSAVQISALLASATFGIPVFLGPIGQVGICTGMDGEHPDHGLDGTTPESIPNASRALEKFGPWKRRCTQYLQGKGMPCESLLSCRWLQVRMHIRNHAANAASSSYQPSVTIQWPAHLCFFRKQAADGPPKSSNGVAEYNPLAFAEKWLSEQAARDATTSARQKEKERELASKKTKADETSVSSQALRSGEVVGAIYPTPPDAVPDAMTSGLGVTPILESNVPTPGLASASTTQELADTNETPSGDKDGSGADNDQSWDQVDDKREVDFRDQSTDNLFEDLDGDLFGESNVTDADFSFFDDPDFPIVAPSAALSQDPAKFKDIDTETMPMALDTPQTPHGANALKDSIFDHGQIADTGSPETNDHDVATKSLGPDTAPEIDIFTNQIIEPPPEIITPPLNPEDVFRKLSSMSNDSKTVNKVDSSVFAGLSFNPALSSFASKYGSYGRFDTPIVSRATPRTASIALPETDYMHKRQKRKSAIIDKLTPGSSDFASPQATKLRRDSISIEDSDVASRDGSPMSDQDDDSDAEEQAAISVASISHKRKRELDDDDYGDDVAATYKSIHRAATDSADSLEDSVCSKILCSDYADWSLAPYFRLSLPARPLIPFEDAEYIAIAQTLAEQAMSGIFAIHPMNSSRPVDTCATDEQRAIVYREVLDVARLFFKKLEDCSLTTYVDISDGANVGQHRLPLPRHMPNASKAVTLQDAPRPIFPLGAPHLEVTRADAKLSVIPSAVSFWSTLGLGPAKGAKDVSAVVIHPRGIGLFDSVKAFLEHIGSFYESGRLGSHERFSTDDYSYEMAHTSSLDPVSLQSATHLTAPTFPSFQEINTRLGRELTKTTITGKNFVIYYLYDETTPEVLVHICSAFHNLYELYKAAFTAAKTPITNELVLQLVPLSFVASTSAMVIPAPAAYASLAMEVYDRCVNWKTGSVASAIVIEKPLPRIIDFKLSATPSASLLQENSVMHVAYAQSVDGRWITVAWTDSTGNIQHTAAYSLGRKKACTSMNVVAAEIWDTTLDIISSRKVNWRIMIARCGAMLPAEIDFWKGLATSDANRQISLTLITVDTQPTLQLQRTPQFLAPSALLAQLSIETTPISTPQASIVSPEQSGNAATPGAAGLNASTPTEAGEMTISPDATLVDVREQSWGAVLSHRLNNSNSLLEIYPALISGYLIKSTGSAVGDVPALMEVNILHCEVNPRLYEALLKEILMVYRGLGTLARARGRTDRATDVRPWHIAAAEKASDVVYSLM